MDQIVRMTQEPAPLSGAESPTCVFYLGVTLQDILMTSVLEADDYGNHLLQSL